MAPVGATFRSMTAKANIGPVIPDSGSLQARYDFSEEDGSLPVTDHSVTGNDLDSGSYSGVSASINGVQAAEFDGTDDGLLNASASGSGYQTVHMVVDGAAQTDVFMFVLRGAANGHFVSHGFSGGTSEYGLRNAIFGGSTGDTPSVLTFTVDGNGDGEIRQDGTSVATGTNDSVSGDLNNDIALGYDNNTSGRNWAGSIGEMLIYPDIDSARTTDAEQYLADKWGITI